MATSPSTIVDAIDAAILDMLQNGGAQELTIGGRKFVFSDLEQLRALRRDYVAMSAQAATVNGTRPLRMQGVRFREPA